MPLPHEWEGAHTSSSSTSRAQPPPAISEEAIAALRESIRRRIVGQCTDGDLREILQQLSGEARGKGLHAEQAIILLKQVWREVAETAPTLEQDERARMLAHLVTLCIDEYYGEQ